MLFLILMRYIVRKKQHRRSCANQEFLIESLELSSQKKDSDDAFSCNLSFGTLEESKIHPFIFGLGGFSFCWTVVHKITSCEHNN